MADNFDLKKFLKESKALENLNPSLRSINENESRKERADVDKYEYEKGKKAGKNEEIKAKIREKILAELTGDIEDDPDAKLNADYDPVYEGEGKMYFHVLEDAGYGEIGHQGVYDTKEEAQNRANSLDDMFPNSSFYVETSDSEDEPYSVTSSDYDPDKDFNEGKETEDDKIRINPTPIRQKIDVGEAKKKDEEVEDVETTDVETTDTTEEVPAEEAPVAGGGLEDVAADMEGTEGDLMDSLMKAFKIAKGMGNEKLETQVGNTLKFFVSEYIGGGEQ
jgi:hypothetical protein